MKKLKVGIIGLGRIASTYENDKRAKKFYRALTHAGAYRLHPNTEIVCGADLSSAKCVKFRKQWNVPRVYTDYMRMLKENKLDILSICTHPDKHYEIIKNVSGLVKVIFCEKPFTGSSSEIKKIIELQRKKGLKIDINVYRQYDRTHEQIKKLIKNKILGDVQAVHCYYGKGLRNMGSHLLAFLFEVFGTPKETKVLYKRSQKGFKEFSYGVHFTFNGQIPASLQVCDYNKFRLFEIDIVCGKGRIRVVDEGLRIELYSPASNRAETGAKELRLKKKAGTTIGSALYYAVDNLADLAQKKGDKAVYSPEKYLKVQDVIEEIEKKGKLL